MSVWKVYAKKADFKGIGEKYGIDQVLARVIRNRGLTEDSQYDQYLNGNLKCLADKSLIKDMEKAVDILKDAIKENKKIRIIGDYDIDGICSIYILHQGLMRAFANVDYVVPNRVIDGYGINENLIKDAKNDGIDVIITCDNGIAAKDAISYAKELGIVVIVTDHHNVPFDLDENGVKKYILPPADAVIDTKQKDCKYPYKEMCGAGVVLRLVEALLDEPLSESEFMKELLEFAAIATVGDVVELQGENRILVKEGLKHINKGSKNLGLMTLMDVCGVKASDFSAYHIGFVVGPCLNASGRLDTAKKAIDLLECVDENAALDMATDLKALNDERKYMTEKGVEDAANMITSEYGDKIPPVLMVYLPDCHESIAGIIAGRIRERYYRPTFIFTDSIGDEKVLKASGRSIEQYNMFDKISEQKDLLVKFGGHPMAAGLTLKKDDFDAFKIGMINNANLSEGDLTEVSWIDVPMPLEYVTEDIINQLNRLEPFGKGNEKPMFADKDLFVQRKFVMGKERDVLKLLLVTKTGYTAEAIMFRATKEQIAAVNEGDNIAILYYPSVNEFNQRRTIQFVVREITHF